MPPPSSAPRLPRWLPPSSPTPRRPAWQPWLPVLGILLAAGLLLPALGPALGHPRLAPAAPLPRLDTTGPAPLTWAAGETGAAAGTLHARPGFGIGSGRLPQPGSQTATALDRALDTAVAAAAHEPAPPTDYDLAALAPATALRHDLTLAPTLIDGNGMLATWGSRPLTSDADFGTPLLDDNLDVAGTLRNLDADLAAGTPLMAAAAGLEPQRRWQPPARPALPDMPARTTVARPQPLALPGLAAVADPAARGGLSEAEFNALWQAARQAPGAPAPVIGSVSDADFNAALQAAARTATPLESWLALQAELDGLEAAYGTQAGQEAYQPLSGDQAAAKALLCGLVGAHGIAQWAGSQFCD